MIKNKIGSTLEIFEKYVSVESLTTPNGYTGLSAFHKYWGKKPIECLGFLIEKLTQPHDLIVDPFVGSGLIARECAVRQRRFIGIDINPVSIELSRMVSDLPSLELYVTAVRQMENSIRLLIDESYLLTDGNLATHYLWDCDRMKEVWISRNGKIGREVREPTTYDQEQLDKFKGYTSSLIRPLHFFKNSRINTDITLTLSDIFTGRALRNIDLIIENIPNAPENVRRALVLTLTASIGQMSNMVFAITGRGKTTGQGTGKIEVGSWVIGYWRPPLHFEINTWNCFQRRANKLIYALSNLNQPPSFKVADSIEHVIAGISEIALLNGNSTQILQHIPQASVALVLTDPPHSDRIPYLELSELWNAIINKEVNFQDEIVVSNARGRDKTKLLYNFQLSILLEEVERVLVPGGTLALLFNARNDDSWNGLMQTKSTASLQYYGCFPMVYSANSVVQDNRSGSMTSDYVLIYRKTGSGIMNGSFDKQVCTIPGWSKDFPKAKDKKDAIYISDS